MKKILLTTITTGAFAVASNALALLASDVAGNYTSWTNGANQGTGFGAWSLSASGGGFAGFFLANPSTGAGISGMPTSSFGMYANPTNSGASANADRSFTSAMSVGDTFSFQWGINYDSGINGAKGFNIYTGAPGIGEIINANNGGSDAITFNGNNTGFGYGTNVMTWSFTLADASTLAVSASDRDGAGTFSTNLTVTTAPLSFRFYTYQNQADSRAEPYFNNLSVVPEPSTYALLALSAAGLAGYAARRRARK